jgi:hypothetical protein
MFASDSQSGMDVFLKHLPGRITMASLAHLVPYFESNDRIGWRIICQGNGTKKKEKNNAGEDFTRGAL